MHWLQLPDNTQDTQSFSAIMDKVIKDTARENIVELGFMFVDSGRMILGKYYPDLKDCPYSATQNVGLKILTKVFNTHTFVQSTIIDHCLNRVEALHVCAMKYLDLLEQFVTPDILTHSDRVILIFLIIDRLKRR
jgi:hypothetical protein